jgi:sugar phosphate permease
MLLCLIFVLGAQNGIAAMGPAWNLAGLCAIYFFIQGPTSIIVGTAAMDIGRGGGTATAVGFINGLGALGAAVQGPVIGFLSDKYGWEFLFRLLMFMSIAPCVLMATVWLEERRR